MWRVNHLQTHCGETTDKLMFMSAEQRRGARPFEWRDGITGRGTPHPQSVSSVTRDTWKRRRTQRKREEHKNKRFLLARTEEKLQTVQTDDVIRTQHYRGLDFKQGERGEQRNWLATQTDAIQQRQINRYWDGYFWSFCLFNKVGTSPEKPAVSNPILSLTHI